MRKKGEGEGGGKKNKRRREEDVGCCKLQLLPPPSAVAQSAAIQVCCCRRRLRRLLFFFSSSLSLFLSPFSRWLGLVGQLFIKEKGKKSQTEGKKKKENGTTRASCSRLARFDLGQLGSGLNEFPSESWFLIIG